MPETMRLIDPDGITRDVALDAVPGLLSDSRWRVPTAQDEASRLSTQAAEESYGGVGGGIKAGAAALARGATLGLSDVAARALGGEDTAIALEGYREAHPYVSFGGELIGNVAPALVTGGALAPAGAAASLGRSAASAAGGGLRGALAAGVVEGGLAGVGLGASELALSRDPLTFERAAATLGSNALFGAGVGGALGAAANGVERGLHRAGAAIDEYAARRAAREAVAPDLVNMDRKGLKLAEEAELARVEAERVGQRASVADEIATFRDDLKQQKIWLTTKKGADEAVPPVEAPGQPSETPTKAPAGLGDEVPVPVSDAPSVPVPDAPVTPPQIEGLGPLGKRLLKTDRQLDRLLDNPKALADRPQRALDALQMQEAAYEALIAKSDQLRIKFAADTSGDRIAALEAIPAALERNRQLQQKIGELLQPPKTPRLDAIAEARDVLMQPAAPKGMVEQIFGGAAFGAVTSAVGSIPVLGQIPGVAAIIGAKGAELATRVVFGKMGASIGAQAERAGNIVKALTGAVKTAAPFAPVVATRTLAALRYGKDEGEQPQSLPALYKKRTDEIKQLTAYDETGTPRLRPAVREQLGRALRPVAAVDPILADRIETQKARGIEYLSSILPRRPDLPGVNDNWHPSDMDMRSWARSAAAVEDPYGVLERAIHGAVTPEDAAVMRNVWPEMLAAFTGEVMARRESVPYHRQLSLSILTGAPVTPAMDPKVMRLLQGQFPDEPGSAGGTQAPKAQPQFGSMRATTDQMTPSQSRVQGAV